MPRRRTPARWPVPTTCADAALRQCGVIRVDDCNELYETAMLLRTRRWPRGTRAAATTISGGNGVLLVDHGAALGISWPEYTAATRAALAAILPKMATTANPTDVSNAADRQARYIPPLHRNHRERRKHRRRDPDLHHDAGADLQAAVEAWKSTDKPVAMLWIGKCNDDPQFTQERMAAGGMPVYRNTLSCLKAVRAAMRYGRILCATAGRRPAARPAGIDVDAARRQLQAAQGTLTERASKQVLAAYGFPVTREALATRCRRGDSHCARNRRRSRAEDRVRRHSAQDRGRGDSFERERRRCGARGIR